MIEDANKTIKQIIAVVLCIVILPVGIYVVNIVMQTIDTTVDTTYEQTFTVTDATVDQLLDTSVYDLGSIVITQYDGVSWTVVPSANISYTDTTITIEHEGLVWRIE